jgi:hypothetical protein
VAITGVTLGPDGNTTLTLERPLVYTHLGEVVTVPGDTRGHRLDMRAEVAVLNRWEEGRGRGNHLQALVRLSECTSLVLTLAMCPCEQNISATRQPGRSPATSP